MADTLPLFSSPCRIVVSASTADRLDAARAFLRESLGPAPADIRHERSRVPRESRGVLIVGASRGAADDLARSVAAERIATFGIQRVSLPQLAARTALAALASTGRTPATWLGSEAVAARAVFSARESGALAYFGPVAGTPGFPRALARTMNEMRLADADAVALADLAPAGTDLQALFVEVARAFGMASTADRAVLYNTAAEILECSPSSEDALILLDVPLENPAEIRLVRALVRRSLAALATLPSGDAAALAALESIGGVIDRRVDRHDTSLTRLHRFLFNAEEPPEVGLDGSVEFFSAPSEGRECVEIARRVLIEANGGVRFDEMAIFVRSPASYFGLLEHALSRACIPAWFEPGTRRPHPAGRAFLALLACACEQLSAARFAEYLSLAQVPASDGIGGPEHPRRDVWIASDDEVFGRVADRADDELEREARESEVEAVAQHDERSVIAGTLRAPWRWERLLAEAAVIGQDVSRWQRRLDGALAASDAQIAEAVRLGGPDDSRARGLLHARVQLEHLRAFALPVVRTLASWPSKARWGEWLDHFESLTPDVLRAPARVLRVLADLRPMAAVGPITLDEARRVLSDRLLMLESEPPSRRYGRIFVGTPQQGRGRVFRVVFIPGLAERMFPQKPREDPLLLDDLRRQLCTPLTLQHDRLVRERQLLQLAASAAAERLYVSYPRIELSESRPRVPSFYALDVMRAATGRIPHYEQFEDLARDAGQATLAWPAPSDPQLAIDDQEYDLAMLRGLLARETGDVRGHAHYLLKLNEALRRSVIDRWARSQHRWSPNDGLIRIAAGTKEALEHHRLNRRPYSPSTLQRFSACPYQFVLAAVYKLQPLERPEPLQRLDPLTRGSIFHEIQAKFFRVLRDASRLPITRGSLSEARAILDRTIRLVAEAQHEVLAPAVERLWNDEIDAIARDLYGWLEFVAADGEEWTPKYFEFGFGTVPGERDSHSRRDHVTVGPGFQLRGAVDLIEEHAKTKTLRVTDHKTGRRAEKVDQVIVGGGAMLQPVLYGMAAEQALQQKVDVSRLFYCTAAGGFSSHLVPMSDGSREAGLEALAVIDRAIESGFLAAAPTEEACSRCDFRIVCGPGVFRRVAHKPQRPLIDLIALRSLP